MTTTVPDVDTIDHLDFDPTLPCELRRCIADRPPADWVMRQEAECGCRTWALCCEPCRRHVQATWPKPDASITWRCLRCRATLSAPAAVNFTPIKENP